LACGAQPDAGSPRPQVGFRCCKTP
jgi:hypothetical protein